jgi:hypothetical protein
MKYYSEPETSHGPCDADKPLRTQEEGAVTMTSVPVQIEPVELKPPVLDEPASADDIVHECGLGSFPASDPPSWWAAAAG